MKIVNLGRVHSNNDFISMKGGLVLCVKFLLEYFRVETLDTRVKVKLSLRRFRGSRKVKITRSSDYSAKYFLYGKRHEQLMFSTAVKLIWKYFNLPQTRKSVTLYYQFVIE